MITLDPPKQNSRSLKALQDAALPRLDWRTLLTGDGVRDLTEADVSALDAHFRKFVDPKSREGCIACGAQQGGDMIASFLGTAKFTWGLAHGEGFCSNRIDGKTCGYPARAYHRDIGPIKFLNVILQYHPDELHDGKSGKRASVELVAKSDSATGVSAEDESGVLTQTK